MSHLTKQVEQLKTLPKNSMASKRTKGTRNAVYFENDDRAGD